MASYNSIEYLSCLSYLYLPILFPRMLLSPENLS